MMDEKIGLKDENERLTEYIEQLQVSLNLKENEIKRISTSQEEIQEIRGELDRRGLEVEEK